MVHGLGLLGARTVCNGLHGRVHPSEGGHSSPAKRIYGCRRSGAVRDARCFCGRQKPAEGVVGRSRTRAYAGDARAPAPDFGDWQFNVSEDDLRAIAKRGYEGAVTTDLDQQAQAVGLFLNDALLQI
jgi:hypothetical protein